ncbi:MAG: hypothetical protein SF123_20680 [Chloroflexota bacterium]|nr:hypothetical protein [Chloroflexota bacterium]
MSLIAPLLVFLILLYPLAGMRRWLQQHVFKVGWLLTKNLQTTTILFYTLFLPGVILYEVVYWLAAGILNVRAERALQWPEGTAIAELRLSFVKLAKNTGGLRLALIAIAPFFVSGLTIYAVANNVLNVDEAAAILQAQGIRGLGDAIGRIFSAPDIFLWIYLLFAIGNTMMPRWSDLKGARILLIIAGVLAGGLVIFGVLDDAIANGLLDPFNRVLNLLSTVFAVVIGVNLAVTAVLGTIEAAFERVTGDSATFQNGKLVAVTRAERLEAERKAQEQAAKVRQTARAKTAIATGPPSIYRLPLPTPPAPGRDVAEQVTVRRDEERVLGAGSAAPAPAAPVQPSLPGGIAPTAPRILTPGQPAASTPMPSVAKPPLALDAEDETDDSDEDDDDMGDLRQSVSDT